MVTCWKDVERNQTRIKVMRFSSLSSLSSTSPSSSYSITIITTKRGIFRWISLEGKQKSVSNWRKCFWHLISYAHSSQGRLSSSLSTSPKHHLLIPLSPFFSPVQRSRNMIYDSFAFSGAGDLGLNWKWIRTLICSSLVINFPPSTVPPSASASDVVHDGDEEWWTKGKHDEFPSGVLHGWLIRTGNSRCFNFSPWKINRKFTEQFFSPSDDHQQGRGGKEEKHFQVQQPREREWTRLVSTPGSLAVC